MDGLKNEIQKKKDFYRFFELSFAKNGFLFLKFYYFTFLQQSPLKHSEVVKN